MLWGIQAAVTRGLLPLEICCDNKNLVELICGRNVNCWGVELLVMDILKCLREKESKVRWVSRKENEVAQFLVTSGLSGNPAL